MRSVYKSVANFFFILYIDVQTQKYNLNGKYEKIDVIIMTRLATMTRPPPPENIICLSKISIYLSERENRALHGLGKVYRNSLYKVINPSRG